MDSILEKSEFRDLLKCREQWTSLPRHLFKYEFGGQDHPRQMEVFAKTEGPKNRASKVLVLIVDVHDSFQMVLPTYMHELLHVCQELSLNEQSKNASAEKINRIAILKEIEAFDLMLKAYRRWIILSKGMCAEEHETREPSLKEIYRAGETEFASGTFSQRVITWYRKIYDMNGVFQESSANVRYQGSDLGPAFEMRHLHPEVAQKIRDLGIPLNEKEP